MLNQVLRLDFRMVKIHRTVLTFSYYNQCSENLIKIVYFHSRKRTFYGLGFTVSWFRVNVEVEVEVDVG